MNQKQLAEFHGVTDRAVRKWPDDKTHRKTIQAEADVTPDEWLLVGEISQLVYLYNAQNWLGEKPTKSAWLQVCSTFLSVSFFDYATVTYTKAIRADVSNTAEMQLIKTQLEQLVY